VKAKPKRPDIAVAVACSSTHAKNCQAPKTVENPTTQTKQRFSFAPEIGVSVPPTRL
jgi:hypothetical protein